MREDSGMSRPSDSLFPGKVFISTVLDALDTKTAMTGAVTRVYLQRAAMAGMIVAVFYGANFSLVSVFAGIHVGETSLAGIGRIVGALTFGWALVFIYFTKSELLTANMMVATIGVYHQRITVARALKLMGICLFGNFLGGLLFAILLRFSSITGGDTGAQMVAAVAKKLEYVSSGPAGWGDLFVRATLCNFLINLAMLLIYNGFVRDDLTRSLAMITAVFLFAYLGLEHSVANTVLFTVVGLRTGVDVGLALGNVALALLGNYVGGGLLIGLYYAMANDDRAYRRAHPDAADMPAKR